MVLGYILKHKKKPSDIILTLAAYVSRHIHGYIAITGFAGHLVKLGHCAKDILQIILIPSLIQVCFRGISSFGNMRESRFTDPSRRGFVLK